MNFRNSFPASMPESAHWTERVVTEGHAAACREHGHATWTVDGVDQGICPRCGIVTAPANVEDDAATTNRLTGTRALRTATVHTPTGPTLVDRTFEIRSEVNSGGLVRVRYDDVSLGQYGWERLDGIILLDPAEDDDDANECEGHESLRGDLMGATFYCDGSCR